MTPLDISEKLGVTVITIEKVQVNEDTYVFGAYQPGSGACTIRAIANHPYTILHELAHAIHDRLFPNHQSFDKLLDSELVADFVAINLSLLDGDMPDPDRLSFQWSRDIVEDFARVLPVATAVLTYIMNVIQG